jgi:hypothetical protein
MPAHVAVGTSLFQILFSSAGITYMQAATNHTVDLILVLPLAASSAVGAQIGARLSRLLRGSQLMILLAILVLLVTGEMMTGLIFTPSNLLRPSETGPHPRLTQHVHTAPRSKLTLDWNSLRQAAEHPLLACRFYKVDSRRRLLGREQSAKGRAWSLKFSSALGGRVAMPGMGGHEASPHTRGFSMSELDSSNPLRPLQSAFLVLSRRSNSLPDHRRSRPAGEELRVHPAALDPAWET